MLIILDSNEYILGLDTTAGPGPSSRLLDLVRILIDESEEFRLLERRRPRPGSVQALEGGKVDVKIVRELYGVMAAKQAPHGVVITSGMFTQDAKNFATGKPIDLVDGHQLLELIGTVQKTPRVEQEKSSTKLCPRCGKELVLRTARQGSGAGDQFWGCSGFPGCRYTENHVISPV